MSRPKRIDLAFTLYHVISRTNSGDTAFQDSHDHEKFLEYLVRYCDLFHYRIYAWCLMKTHFHLLLESGCLARISELMRRLLTAYTVYYNRRNRRHGHLFQGRFKSLVVDKANYLLSVSRYIHLNPSQAQRPADPFKYSGSSLGYYQKGGDPSFLHTKEILGWFGGDRKKYERYVREGLKAEIKLEIYQQRYIGGEDFSRRIRKRLGQRDLAGSRGQKGIRQSEERNREQEQKDAERILLKAGEYFHVLPGLIKKGQRLRGDIGKARTVCMALLREMLPWTGKEISAYLGLKRSLYSYLRRIGERRDLRQSYEALINVLRYRVRPRLGPRLG